MARTRQDLGAMSIEVLRLVVVAGLLVSIGGACAGAPAATSAPQPTSASQPTPAAPATSPAAIPRSNGPAPTDTPAAPGFPLAEPGPHAVGVRSLPTIPDPRRDDRQVSIKVWYPALQSSGPSDPPAIVNDAPPDPGGAPYPVILSSSKIAYIFAPYLVSHGFAWISVTGLEPYPKMSLEMIDQPLDILFALDHVASGPLDGLEGMLDTEYAGVIGYSFDGYNALAMSGARIDSAYYLGGCPTGDTMAGLAGGHLSAYDCAAALEWDEYVKRAGDAVAPGEDGLWQPLTDDRIRAAMPMAGEGWWLFGERGLAAVDRPVLMLAATGDSLYAENARIYDHLGTTDKTFISFLGADHLMVLDQQMVERMAHFATAFFGYHLAGREDMAALFAESFVAGHLDLTWGTVRPH